MLMTSFADTKGGRIFKSKFNGWEYVMNNVVNNEKILEFFFFFFNYNERTGVAVVQQVVCWLIRRKARVRVPGQTSKQNTKIISSAISSQQISGKNSESKKKNCHEKFLKKISFGVDFKLQVPPLMYKINTRNISGVRNQVNNPD